MPTVAETLTANSPLGAAIRLGVNTISRDETVVFDKYVRLVLPLDGYVFWVRAAILSPSALINAFQLNTVVLNQPRTILAPPNPDLSAMPNTITAQGSLHYVTALRQNEDETIAVNAVTFTSEEEVKPFNYVSPNIIYIGTFDGLQFSFSRRDSFYKQSDIYHYVGDAVYPALKSQIIDSPFNVDSSSLVVSNSLPLWLALATLPTIYPPVPLTPPRQTFPLYPSFLVPANVVPPYGVVHIEPGETEAIQAAPFLDPTWNHYQLCKDTVKITLYGLRNGAAIDFQDFVLAYSMFFDTLFGVMNIPVIRDEKRVQVETSVLAMKKTITFEINYYQDRMRDFAMQYILSCIPSYDIYGYSPNQPPEPPPLTLGALFMAGSPLYFGAYTLGMGQFTDVPVSITP